MISVRFVVVVTLLYATAVWLLHVDPATSAALVQPHGPQSRVARVSLDEGVELDSSARRRRDAVVEMALHAWKGYVQFAAGHDELKPVSRRGADGWGGTGPTAFDALDLLLLMGAHDEYAQAAAMVSRVNFDTRFSASVFETTIRHVGAMISAFEMTDDEKFLRIARKVADKLLPAFKTKTGIAMHQVGLTGGATQNEQWCNGKTILAEAGSLQLEFRKLSALSGEAKYARAATKFTDHVVKTSLNGWPTNRDLYESDAPTMPHRGLWPSFVDPVSGKWSGAASLASLSDSYYEYLLKQWILFGKKDDHLLSLYEDTVEAILHHLLRYTPKTHLAYIGHAGIGFEPTLDHLTCFVPGMLILGVMHGAHEQPGRGRSWTTDDVATAAVDLASTCYRLYLESPTGIGPEIVSFESDGTYSVMNPKYILRPELIESLFYLHRYTEDDKYRDWGWSIAEAINKHCRTDAGFTAIADMRKVPAEPKDSMESFFFAETLKYLFLLFSSADVLPLDEFVFNTEGHPFRIV